MIFGGFGLALSNSPRHCNVLTSSFLEDFKNLLIGKHLLRGKSFLLDRKSKRLFQQSLQEPEATVLVGQPSLGTFFHALNPSSC